MPIYEYQCVDCGQRIERLQRLDDPGPEACDACGGRMERAVSAPAFQFKGTGWYVTDYADRKSAGSDGDAKSDGGKGGDSGGDSAGDSGGKSGGKPDAAGGDSQGTSTPPKDSGKSGAATSAKD